MIELKYVSVDMNDYVSIKPKETGWRQIVADVDRRNDNLRKNPECWHRISVPKADADGYISGQFWSLMKSFDWENCDPGGDMPFSDLRIEIPRTQKQTVVGNKSTYRDELRYFVELSKTPIKFLNNLETTLKAKYATYAVDEIRRLRAKVNRLIKAIGDAESNGNHMYSDKDLIEEEEI